MSWLKGTGAFALLVVLTMGSVLLFCEYFIYYCVIVQCAWPRMEEKLNEKPGETPEGPALHAMFLADTHLLGALRGHWFDRLRREWQMERAFQTALELLNPHVVFILGDIFDEGIWSSDKDWEEDVQRFGKIFRHPEDTELIVLAGNHDVGFQNETAWPKLWRFEKVFNVTSAAIVTKKGVNFLVLNSMAMQGKDCSVCHFVDHELFQLSRDLNCSIQTVKLKALRKHCHDAQKFPSSPPIILQHYPLYRISDASCSGLDLASAEARHQWLTEWHDVLSQEASQKLLWWFQPRLILSGHTHRPCEVLHEKKYPEVSVPSFSWRNRNNPSFILGVFSPVQLHLSTCFLPEESSVIVLYCSSGVAMVLLTLVWSYLFKGTAVFYQPPTWKAQTPVV